MDEAPQPLDPEQPNPRRRRRAVWIAAQITLGLALGLVAAELAFAARDQHAFPHVNFYMPDAELGVRLEPNASMAFRLGDNPLTHIAVNSHGYRGPEWPAARAGEVLIVGDSQVFGLGVDDDETFSAVLGERLDRTVINAGVPTYGPREYQAVAAELIEQRPIGTLVVVLNFLNDPFELDRPNRERHAIWDGWAVQIETAPAPGDIWQFPGRKWLMSQSHAVYAARRWWHQRDQAWFDRVDQGLPSEGDWHDLLVDSESVHTRLREAELHRIAAIEDDAARRKALRASLAEVQAELERSDDASDERRHRYDDDEIIAARPGGIVRDRYSEAARDVEVTAEMYREALARRNAHKATQARRNELEARQRDLSAALDADGPAPAEPAPALDLQLSVFEPYFVALAQLCEAHDVELLIVMLPFDVQVSSEEWAKYDVDDGPDMTPTLVLLDDAIASAEQLGIRAIDATPSLRAAEPGAFLDADIHMTPKGHAAIAELLADALQPKPEVKAEPTKGAPEPKQAIQQRKLP